LFPKYAAKFFAKHGKDKSRRGPNSEATRYLPDSEYRGEASNVALCTPDSLKEPQRTKTIQYFRNDCLFPGEKRTKRPQHETKPFDETAWDEAQVNRLKPVFVNPPPLGSLDDQPIFGRKKTKDPADQEVMDSFIIALRQEMGEDYFDINEVRYYPRSDGRVHLFKPSGAKKEHQMKNGHLDVDVFLRNRQIRRQLNIIKESHLFQGIPWTAELEERYERDIVHFVDTRTVCPGRTLFSMQDDLGIEDDRYSAPEPLNREAVTPPMGLNEEGLGQSYFWSERAGRMVTFEEERRRRQSLEQADDFHPTETNEGAPRKRRTSKPPFDLLI
jgi:hypothetical protein